MKEDRNKNTNDEQRHIDDDQLRMNTTNETIREASGDPDTNLNNLKDDVDTEFGDSPRSDDAIDLTQGVHYTPNDASGVRSGGTVDMDDQTSGGAGLDSGTRRGAGSNLTPKKGITGSDYDGQNSTS